MQALLGNWYYSLHHRLSWNIEKKTWLDQVPAHNQNAEFQKAAGFKILQISYSIHGFSLRSVAGNLAKWKKRGAGRERRCVEYAAAAAYKKPIGSWGSGRRQAYCFPCKFMFFVTGTTVSLTCTPILNVQLLKKTYRITFGIAISTWRMSIINRRIELFHVGN